MLNPDGSINPNIARIKIGLAILCQTMPDERSAQLLHSGISSLALMVDPTCPTEYKDIGAFGLGEVLKELKERGEANGEPDLGGMTDEDWENLTGGDPGSWSTDA